MTLLTAGVSMPKPRKSLALRKTEPEHSKSNRLPDSDSAACYFYGPDLLERLLMRANIHAV
jgi:hypothetical protein